MLKEDVFDKCKSLTDIIKVRDKLVRAGADISMVNRLASMAKLRLAEEPGDFDYIEKIRPSVVMSTSKYTHLSIRPIDPGNSRAMIVHGSGVIEF